MSQMKNSIRGYIQMSSVLTYVLIFLCAFFVTAISVPLLTKVANRIGFLDRPTKRKQHKTSVPLVGGVCMFLGFATSFIILMFVSDTFMEESQTKFLFVLLGGLISLSIGIVDDFFKTRGKEFPAWPRIIIHLGIATMVFAVGIRFTGFMVPFTSDELYIHFPFWLQYILTVTWVFGVITVVNWSDGMDGLTGSLCAITSATLFIVAMVVGDPTPAFLTIILVGVTTGFLKYNFFPAKIFMGDSGATFLGYMIAVISVYGMFKQATFISIVIPVLALGVLIFDNLFVIFKRWRNKQPLHKADAGQVHHRLLRSGLSPVQALVFLVLLSGVLNLISVIILLLGV